MTSGQILVIVYLTATTPSETKGIRLAMPGEQPIEVILDLLRAMVNRKASDHFISVDFPPALKIDGQVTPISVKLA